VLDREDPEPDTDSDSDGYRERQVRMTPADFQEYTAGVLGQASATGSSDETRVKKRENRASLSPRQEPHRKRVGKAGGAEHA
jgi:hypothetical protein